MGQLPPDLPHVQTIDTFLQYEAALGRAPTKRSDPSSFHISGRSPRVRGEGKSGKMFTKFCENFGESTNFVNNLVIKLSPNLVKLNVVIIFSQFLVKFLSTILMIFLVRVKSDNIFTKFCENFGESPNFVKNSVLIMSQNLVKLNVVILFSLNFVKF